MKAWQSSLAAHPVATAGFYMPNIQPVEIQQVPHIGPIGPIGLGAVILLAHAYLLYKLCRPLRVIHG